MVRKYKLFTNSLKLKFLAENSISSAAIIISAFYVISALIGLFRNRLLAGYFGDSVELGIFYMADKLPALLFSVFITTVVSSAFIPVFAERRKKSKLEADKYMSNILNTSLLIYLVFSVIIFIFSRFFAQIISWYSLEGDSLDLLIVLMRYILFSQVILIVSTYFSVYLQSYKRFIISSIVPIIYNLGLVAGTIIFYESYGIIAPVLGMILGSILGVLIQLPLMKSLNYFYQGILSFKDISIIKTIKIVMPKILGISAHRLYILVIQGLITIIYGSPSFIVIYEFANQLQTMPVNAFGSALSQAVYPTVSDLAIDNKFSRISSLINNYAIKVTYFVFPLSVMFIILKIPLVRLLFGGDKFSWLGTNLTAYTLAFFSISILFQTLSIILAKVFYSLQNTKIPNYISVITLLFSLLVSIIFSQVFNFGVWSFALGFSLGSFLNFAFLYYKLIPILGNFLYSALGSFIRIGYATIVSGFVTYSLMKYLEDVVFDTTRTMPLFTLTAIITLAGGSVYILLADFLGISIFKEFLDKGKKRILST